MEFILSCPQGKSIGCSLCTALKYDPKSVNPIWLSEQDPATIPQAWSSQPQPKCVGCCVDRSMNYEHTLVP